MDENIIELKNKINSDNNCILYEIIKDLQAFMNYIKEENILTKLRDVINKMNIFIKENNKNLELIQKDISILNNKLNEQCDGLLINNNNNNKELKFRNGKYNGQAVNGLAEGKGIWLGKNGDKYEGEWKLGLAAGNSPFSWFSALPHSLEGDDGGGHRHVERVGDAVHGDDDILVSSLDPRLRDARSLGAHDKGRGLAEVGVEVVDGGFEISTINGYSILF